MFDSFATTTLADYRRAECHAAAAELRLLRAVRAERVRRAGPSLRETVRNSIVALAPQNPLLALRVHGHRDHVRG